MKIHKLTYLLLIVVLATLGLALGGHKQTPTDQAQNEYRKQVQARSQRFPTADFDETDLTDPQKNRARKEKNKRKNDYKLVARNPPLWQSERVAMDEGGPDFPPLPVVQSTLVILGRVTAAEAHVSENKKNVYSEFRVLVEKIFKNPSNSVLEGTDITVDRTGGFVKYPNGHTVLYRISGMNMPLTGERYLFFLTSKNQPDLSILTAYELGANGVIPLDQSSQFEQYRGITEAILIQNLRAALPESSPR